jgi:uncharacterized protein (DUF1501 family)
MKRRSFLKTAAVTAAATPIMLGGMQARANSSLAALAQLPVDDDRILLIIQLFGGNDGLNTVIPALDDEYYRIRPGIGVPKDKCWNGLGDIYLHPMLSGGDRDGIAGMLEMGNLAIVQGVGYDNPNLSHFRSTDIWLSGLNNSDPNVRLETGWVGRYLEKRYPDFPASLPDHPLAVQFGGFSLMLLGSKGRMGIEVTSPDLQQGVSSQLDTLDAESTGTHYQTEYAFVADIANRSNKYAQAVKDAYDAGKPQLKGDYSKSDLARQIGSVAALIAGGLRTKVYVVSMGGFDTHVTQQIAGDINGTHPNLLKNLSNAAAEFMYDMINLDQAKRIVGLTVSEFGRRPNENGSLGTDHGAASVQFVFGTSVNSGVFGNAPDLKNLDANGDLTYQIDYRQVYAELLTDWFGMTSDEMKSVLQNNDLVPLDVIKTPSSVRRESAVAGGMAILGNYPDPFVDATSIDVMIDRPRDVRIEITPVTGGTGILLFDGRLEPGRHRIPFSGVLPSGVYICTMRGGDRLLSHPIRSIR